jgi:hypothetical protein
MEVVQAFIQGRSSRLKVTVDVNDERDGKDFNVDDFYASAAVQAAPRWRSLELITFPPPGESGPHTIAQHLESLWSFSISQSCELGDFFEPLMTAVTTTAIPHLNELCLRNLNAVLYLVQPARLHVFCSLTTLTILLSKRMDGPVDILPHLQSLNKLQARHLHLPVYPPGASLPLIQTLQFLSLKSVSVEWMAGRVFPAL